MAVFRVLKGTREVCAAERMLHPLPFEVGSMVRGLYSVVMFGGVDHRYYKGELNWVPLIQEGGWIVHMDR